MSPKAFIMIETEAGKANKVVTALKEVEGVTTADLVTGPYDIIAVVEEQRLDEIGNIVTGKIQVIPSVSRIVTCLALPEGMVRGRQSQREGQKQAERKVFKKRRPI